MIETINKQHETISKQGASDPFVLNADKDHSMTRVMELFLMWTNHNHKVIHVSRSFLFIEPQSQIALKSCLWSSIKKTAFFLPDRSACNYNEDFADIN